MSLFFGGLKGNLPCLVFRQGPSQNLPGRFHLKTERTAFAILSALIYYFLMPNFSISLR